MGIFCTTHLLKKGNSIFAELVFGKDIAVGRDPKRNVINGLCCQQELLGSIRFCILTERRKILSFKYSTPCADLMHVAYSVMQEQQRAKMGKRNWHHTLDVISLCPQIPLPTEIGHDWFDCNQLNRLWCAMPTSFSGLQVYLFYFYPTFPLTAEGAIHGSPPPQWEVG